MSAQGGTWVLTMQPGEIMSTLDFETLDEIATNCLTRPSDAMFWDDRLFETHGALFSWAELGDDILEESNYKSALSLIQGAAGDDADEHVIDGTARHWACGSLRTIYVQVYESYEDYECECEPTWEHEDECAQDEDDFYCQLYCRIECDGEKCLPEQEFTAAFIEAAELLVGLQDYPIIDESDFSEREWKAFEDNCTEALDQAKREYSDDTIEEQTAIDNLIFQGGDLSELMGYEANAGVDWDKVAEIYAGYRDTYFEELAYEVFLWNVLGYNPDQLTLDIAV
ncbi:hypothetical protein ELB20_74 [Streptomyces phage phiELB20]|uniref:Uncharacterized protein n=1 Tax=Streptomyces phage phiELB20 TaxID=1211278 RepID=I7AUR5_9CAUD|nr:hypothetical protein FDG59_gp10 [Streptomyces phage phiELB20]AFO10940.1 hypothetical protein ELB20_74 [Streptomyces phage phiELB20]